MMKLEFKYIDDENDIMFHKAYVMLCEIFPGMMPYWAFKNYDITVALNEKHECVAFMLLKFSDDDVNDSDYENISSIDSFDSLDSADSADNVENNNMCDNKNSDRNKSSSPSMKMVTIASLGVDIKYRRLGIADAYIKWMKELFSSHAFNLHVSIKNAGAIELYKKNGFEISKLKPKYYTETTFEPYIGEGTNAYQMFCLSNNNTQNDTQNNIENNMQNEICSDI